MAENITLYSYSFELLDQGHQPGNRHCSYNNNNNNNTVVERHGAVASEALLLGKPIRLILFLREKSINHVGLVA